MRELFRRIYYLINRRRFDAELASDLEFHREMSERNGGLPVGNALLLREEARDAWGWTWIDRLGQDLRYAMRVLGKSPGFTLAAVLTLAIGIGANVAAFGFFDLFALRPLPVRDPDTLLRFQRRSPQSYASDVPYPAMVFYGEHSRTLSSVLGVVSSRLTLDGHDRQLNAQFVTPNYFSDLGAALRLGRGFDPAVDTASDAEPVAVLSFGLWQTHFALDPLVLGKTIRLNNQRATVIGVASEEFSGLGSGTQDLWLPIPTQPHFVLGSRLLTDFSQQSSGVNMWGRLKAGITPKMAEDELRVLAAELRRQHPHDFWENERLASEPGGYLMSGAGANSRGNGTPESIRQQMWIVIGLVGTLVLLILIVACGNLGSLLLARGISREREIAIRVSVGAGSGRIVRQLFTESLLLAGLGAAAGLALGSFVLKGLMSLTEVPRWLDATPDWRVILFAICAGFGSAILFGLTPALQLARQRQRAMTMRQVLIGAQVTASCVLLIVAGLLVRALNHALSVNPGFDYQHVIVIDPGLGGHGFSAENARAYLDLLRARLSALGGVETVAMASVAPLGHKTVVFGTEIEGRKLEVHTNQIDTDYFQTMRIPLLRGRNFIRGESGTIIVSEALARRYWPSRDALGQIFDADQTKYTVVGIAGEARTTAMQDPEAVQAYFPSSTPDLTSMTVLVRTVGPPENIAAPVVAVAKGIDPKVIPSIELMKASFRTKLQGMERSSLAASLLGVVALLLACLGILGMVAYAVSQRTKEIGLRMALGARPEHILSVVLRQFSRPVIFGLLAGVCSAAVFTHALRRQLYGISNLDPLTYVGAIALFCAAVVVAALVPAKRALDVDPMQALRQN